MNHDLFPIMEEKMNIITEKIGEYTEQLCYMDSSTKEAFDKEIEIAGFFSVHLWIQNNLDFSSYEDFLHRLSCYEEILTDKRYVDGFQKIKNAGGIALFQEFGDSFIDEVDPFFERLDTIKTNSFLQGVSLMQELLQDKEIQKKEKKSHFQLFSNHIDNYSNIIDVYRTLLANEKCLEQLKEIKKDLLEESSSKKNR